MTCPGPCHFFLGSRYVTPVRMATRRSQRSTAEYFLRPQEDKGLLRSAAMLEFHLGESITRSSIYIVLYLAFSHSRGNVVRSPVIPM